MQLKCKKCGHDMEALTHTHTKGIRLFLQPKKQKLQFYNVQIVRAKCPVCGRAQSFKLSKKAI